MNLRFVALILVGVAMCSPLFADGPRRTSPAAEDEWIVGDDGVARWARSARFLVGDPDDGDFPPYVDAAWDFSRTVIDPAESRMADAVNRAVIAHIAATFGQVDYGENEVPVDENLPWHRVDPRGGITESCTATFVSDELVSFNCHRNWVAVHPGAGRETIIFTPDGDDVRSVGFEELLAGREAKDALLALLEERVRRILAEDGAGSPNSRHADEISEVAANLLRDAWLRPGGIASLTFPAYGSAFDVDLSLLEVGDYLRPDVAEALARSEPLGPIDLHLEPGSTLPSLPVALHFTVRTESSSAVRVPERGLLIVTPESGDPFVARLSEVWMGEALHVADLSGAVEGAAVRKTSDASFSLPERLDLGISDWFADSRLAVPGVYTLQLLLDDELTEQVILGCSARDLLAGALPRAVISHPASLIVERPAGHDAEAWRYLTSMYEAPSSATLSGNRYLAGELWRGYRESAYARRLAILVPGTGAERAAVANEMARSSPVGPLRDEWMLRAAEREMEAYLEFHFSGNEAVARVHAATAIETLSRLAAAASDPALRTRAAGVLDDAQECLKASRCSWNEIRTRRSLARWNR